MSVALPPDDSERVVEEWALPAEALAALSAPLSASRHVYLCGLLRQGRLCSVLTLGYWRFAHAGEERALVAAFGGERDAAAVGALLAAVRPRLRSLGVERLYTELWASESEFAESLEAVGFVQHRNFRHARCTGIQALSGLDRQVPASKLPGLYVGPLPESARLGARRLCQEELGQRPPGLWQEPEPDRVPATWVVMQGDQVLAVMVAERAGDRLDVHALACSRQWQRSRIVPWLLQGWMRNQALFARTITFTYPEDNRMIRSFAEAALAGTVAVRRHLVLSLA